MVEQRHSSVPVMVGKACPRMLGTCACAAHVPLVESRQTCPVIIAGVPSPSRSVEIPDPLMLCHRAVRPRRGALQWMEEVLAWLVFFLSGHVVVVMHVRLERECQPRSPNPASCVPMRAI